jgi:catechol 2,3-dioxygenase
LLLPTRADLARTIRRLVETRTPLTGMSDHGVSEAIYLNDPDGHGIEIYRDRPRAEWPVRDGALEMTLDPLNVASVLAEVTHGRVAWHGIAEGTRVGHVHLHVRDLEEARRFYCDVLGFDLMQAWAGQAIFVAAGGYHHHLGLNVWAGVGATPPPDDAARLDWYEIRLPSDAAYAQVVARLRAAGVGVAETLGVATLRDPSGNTFRLIDSHLEGGGAEQGM